MSAGSIGLTPTSSEPEEELARLLSRYGAELVRARAMNGTRVMAEIVSEYGSLEDVGGFYFSAETIRILAEFGVSVDIDVVRRIT